MDIDLAPKPKRRVTFEVDEKEAGSIVGWINDAIQARPNTPYSSDGVRKIMYAFAEIRDGK